MKKLVVLGATGSIGTSVLSVVRDHPDRFAVTGLVACRGGEELAALAREFPDAALAFHNAGDLEGFRRYLGDAGGRRVLVGPEAGVELTATVDADVCVAAVAGTAGLAMAFAAAERGMRVLLAEKEVMVSAGRLFLKTAAAGGAEILPLDSEHSALHQCLAGRDPASVEKVIITASGGPFRTWDQAAIAAASPEDALRHPVWRMGAKITIDSSTLANKALEVIEAHHLFGLPFERMEVMVHPQSLVHGLVEMTDGSVLAQLGLTDMRGPASYALFYPERENRAPKRLNLCEIGQLNFESPDRERFPMLDLGIAAGKSGEKHSAVFNAANEAAVEAFLAGKILFGRIAGIVEDCLVKAETGEFSSLPEVENAHRTVRARVTGLIG